MVRQAASVDPARPRRRRPPGGRVGSGPERDRERVEGAGVPARRHLPARERAGPAPARRHHRLGVHGRGLGDRERRRHGLGEDRLPRERLVARRPHPHACGRAQARVAPGRARRSCAIGSTTYRIDLGRRARPGRRAILPPVRTAELDYAPPRRPDRPGAGRAALERAAPGVRPRDARDPAQNVCGPARRAPARRPRRRERHPRPGRPRSTPAAPPAGPSNCCSWSGMRDGAWDALARPARRLRAGETLDASGTPILVAEVLQEGHVTVTLRGCHTWSPPPRADRGDAGAAVHPPAARSPRRLPDRLRALAGIGGGADGGPALHGRDVGRDARAGSRSSR